MMLQIYTAIVALVTLALLYLAYFWKINWIRDLTAKSEATLSVTARYKAKKNRKIGQLPPVYPNGWFGLLDSSALKKDQVQHVAALGQNFAVFRTESGKVRIMEAYCPHLGANMAEGGMVKGEELECPFHSWKFCGETGKCTDIPYAKNVPSAIKTKVWESLEANGVIFVWYHAESSPPDWKPQEIEEIANGSWQYQGRNEFYVNCHIQEIPENGADWAHLNTVHGPPPMAQNLLSKIIHHSWTEASWSSESSPRNDQVDQNENLAEEKSAEKHKAVSRLKHSLLFFHRLKILQLDVQAHQIGPGYVVLHLQSTFGPVCIVQTVTPVQPLLQKVVHLVFSSMLIAPFARIVLIGETLMFERDVRVWNHKKFIKSPLLINEEKSIQAYRRWFKQFYSEKSPTYESCLDTIDW